MSTNDWCINAKTLIFFHQIKKINAEEVILSYHKSIKYSDNLNCLNSPLLTLCLPVSSADKFGKQFGPRSGPTTRCVPSKSDYHGFKVICIEFRQTMLFMQNNVVSLFVYQCRLLITLANSLDPDQARRIVGPDQGSNCLTF